jgi:Fe2+ transport system protein B
MILAVFYPSGALSFSILVGFMTAAILVAIYLRRRRIKSRMKTAPIECRPRERPRNQQVSRQHAS